MQEAKWDQDALKDRLDLLIRFAWTQGLPSHVSERLLQHVYLVHARSKISDMVTEVPQQLYARCCLPMAEAISECSIFADFKPPFLRDLVMTMEDMHLIPGDMVYQAGEVADAMYFVRCATAYRPQPIGHSLSATAYRPQPAGHSLSATAYPPQPIACGIWDMGYRRMIWAMLLCYRAWPMRWVVLLKV